MAEALKSANSARPAAVVKPVPGKAAASNVDAFFADYQAPEVSAQTSSGEEAYEALPAVAEEPSSEPGIGMKALDVTGRVLDYAGGFSRAGLAEVAGIATGNPNLVTEEDLKAAVKGKGPDSAEYLRRLGVPEGGSIDTPLGKVTIRGASGFALDIATDPLTALTKLVKKAPYLAKIVNAPGAASEALGEAVYKSALPKGAKIAGDVLIESGAPMGGTAKIAQKVKDLSETMAKTRQGLYDKANQLGVSIDSAFPLKRAEAVLTEMRKDPGLAPAVQELEQLLGRYKGAGKVPVDVVSEWKTNLYDALPATAFNGAKLKGKSKMFKRALAADFREAIVQAGNKAEPGLGDAINVLNDKWGTLLSATHPLEKATQASGGRLGTMIDGAVLAGGGVKGVALKKSYDIATSPFAKTVVGRALMEAGKHDLVNRVSRQMLAAPTRSAPKQEPEEPQE